MRSALLGLTFAAASRDEGPEHDEEHAHSVMEIHDVSSLHASNESDGTYPGGGGAKRLT
jgi:hypothetical protein